MQKVTRKYVDSDAPETPFSEDEALITLPTGGTGSIQKSDDMFDDVTNSGGWLPRLQLMSSNSKPCKDGKFPVNNYALVNGSNLTKCGPDVDVLVVDWRPKALEMGDEIISVYDKDSAEFKRIQEKSGEQDSGCMFGPEFLVWVASQKQFALFFMGSASARREAPAIRARLQKAATLKVQMIEGKKHSWAAPSVIQCSTPIDLPEEEATIAELEKFNNPKESDVERVDEKDAPADGGRAR